jgi:glutathione S-transferase
VSEYVSVAEARNMSGLRLVLSPGVPGPWSEGIKGIFDVKKIPYVRANQDIGGDYSDLLDWTSQAAAPIAAWNDEWPRVTWIEQLNLAERLQPEPPLIPDDIHDRALMYGLCNELLGQNGLVWMRRLMVMQPTMADPESQPEEVRNFLTFFAGKYNYDGDQAKIASARVVEILKALSEQMAAQKAKGSKYLIGDRLSALDIYWSTAAAILSPLPHNMCPMPDNFRHFYSTTDADIEAALDPALLEHRDFVYQNYLVLPLDM